MVFTIKKMSPVLLVADIAAAIKFYKDKLGFVLEFQYGDFYAGLTKDGYSIHLKGIGDELERRRRPIGEDIDIAFLVEEIDRVYEQMISDGVEVIQPLRKMPYGKEFYIMDPDGNRLAFME